MMGRSDWKKFPKSILLEPVSVFLLFLYISYQNAWLSDDSFISFRVIDHFVNGNGLHWNIAERVQAFTNPLLILVLSPFYYLYQNIVLWSLFSSFIWGLATFYYLRKIAVSSFSFWIGITFLLSSRSFVDYTYSGLENSLNYFLAAIFFYHYFKEEESERSKLPVLVLIASVGLVSRIDFVLIFILPISLLLRKEWKNGKVDPSLLFKISVSTWPAILWFLFSSLYYGSLLPNTYYAKTNVEEPFSQILQNGWNYYIFEMKWDPIVFFFLPFVAIIRIFFKKNNAPIWVFFGFSLPYFIYIFSVGGDFMAGRFFTYVIFLFGIALVRMESLEKKEIYILSSALIFYNILLLSTPIHPISQQIKQNPWKLGKDEIADEKLWYFPATGLVARNKENSLIPYLTRKKFFVTEEDHEKVLVKYNVGFFGFLHPSQHILDHVGLGDPLLSRIKGKGRIGHKIRSLPFGYFDSLEFGENRIQDLALREYYDSLMILTRGELFDPKRFGLFWRFQFGDLRKYSKPYIVDEVLENKIRKRSLEKGSHSFD
ncbi:hypothetical protein [Leptospira sarikeiensis]|uniref:Glycosyltransferase RgtA/B/C/D-like domain-containing protein n=1 Tax=Leptospira sarikeiensis TaxID=2484943 RepID=A0A4R9KBZ2_9LEPT|nr:hypothetical protein [Leptospira sarikeiensis]TGL63596.1 hypothetical protein EHQ64_06500 [Leptospira sarikeiensis]